MKPRGPSPHVGPGGAARKAVLLLAALCGCARRPAGQVEAAQSVYVRTDSDATTVVSPRTKVVGTVGDDLSVEAAYAVDVWTGASIDVVTAATRAIHEERHEVQAGAGYRTGNLTVAGTFRHSNEPDYQSNGGVLRGALELFQKNTTIALTLFGSGDTVGRAGDPWFAEPQWSLGGRLAVTQILGKQALAELSWESSTLQGFQASPYRWVAIGGQGICADRAPFCVPEQVPDERYRHAVTAAFRHAGPGRTSIGAKYRFYFDSWGLLSHTLEPDLAFSLGDDGTLSLRYRHYTQGEADFYQPRYFELATATYVTRDRKLSALQTQTLGITYTQDLQVGSALLSLGLSASGTYFSYLAFVGLEHVRALEITALFGGKLDFAGGRLSAARDLPTPGSL